MEKIFFFSGPSQQPKALNRFVLIVTLAVLVLLACLLSAAA